MPRAGGQHVDLRSATAFDDLGAPALTMLELVAIGRRLGDDGGDLGDRATRAAIALREQPAEFVHRIHRVEADGTGVGAYPGAGIKATRPFSEVVAFQRLEQLAL